MSDSDTAPGRLNALCEFVNTLTMPANEERLGSLADAAACCAELGLPAPTASDDLARLREMREAWRDAIEANDEEANAAEAWRGIARFASEARLRVEIDPERGPQLAAVGVGLNAIVAALLSIAHDAIVAGTWKRMRACRRSDCRWVYYDRSKNGSRAWCSMSGCGNRAKAQRRRERERSAP